MVRVEEANEGLEVGGRGGGGGGHLRLRMHESRGRLHDTILVAATPRLRSKLLGHLLDLVNLDDKR